MELVYKYKYLNIDGEESLLKFKAQNMDVAYWQYKQIKDERTDKLRIDWWDSIRNLILEKPVSSMDLATFYHSLSKRLQIGQPIVDTLEESILFVNDPLLKHQIAVLQSCVQFGDSISKGMGKAQFPLMHYKTLNAVESTGKTPEALLDLSKEIERTEKLRKTILSLLIMPAITATIIYFGIWFCLSFVSPKLIDLLKQSGSKISQLKEPLASYFQFIEIIAQYQPFSTLIYLALGVAFVLMLRSNWLRVLLSKIGIFRDFADKVEHARVWGNFAQLYDAGLDLHFTCQMIGESCLLKSNRDSFEIFKRKVTAGTELSKAVEMAAFPKYVVRAIRSSVKTDVVTGLRRFVDLLLFEIESMQKKLGAIINTTAIALLTVGVLAMFCISYLPTYLITMAMINK